MAAHLGFRAQSFAFQFVMTGASLAAASAAPTGIICCLYCNAKRYQIPDTSYELREHGTLQLKFWQSNASAQNQHKLD